MALEQLKGIYQTLLCNVLAMGYVNGVKSTVKMYSLNEDAGIENWIIGLAVGILVLAYVLPMAFNAFYLADVSKFCKTTIDASGNATISKDSTVISLWYLIPVLIIVGIIIFFATHRHQT